MALFVECVELVSRKSQPKHKSPTLTLEDESSWWLAPRSHIHNLWIYSCTNVSTWCPTVLSCAVQIIAWTGTGRVTLRSKLEYLKSLFSKPRITWDEMSCCKAVVIGNIMLIHFVYLLTVIAISQQNKNIKNTSLFDHLLCKMAPCTLCIYHVCILISLWSILE